MPYIKTENVRLSYISEHDRYGFNTQKKHGERLFIYVYLIRANIIKSKKNN